MYRTNAWEQYSGEERALLSAFADDYRSFLDSAKTEREAADEAERLCRAAGIGGAANETFDFYDIGFGCYIHQLVCQVAATQVRDALLEVCGGADVVNVAPVMLQHKRTVYV